MTSTELISLLFGKFASNHFDKFIKQVVAVVRTRGGLWVILNTEGVYVFTFQAFHHPVVETSMSNLHFTKTGRRARSIFIKIYSKSMVVRSHLNPSGFGVENWLVNSPVPKLELIGVKSQSSPQ